MAIPAEIVLRTVTYGPETDFQGNAVTGTLTFTPSEDIMWVATGQGFHVKPITVNLNSSGSGSVDLICTDQAGFRNANGQDITNWYYTASADLAGVPGSTRKFVVPSGSGSLDLDTMIPITTGSTTISIPAYVSTVAGRTGAVTLTKNDVGLSNIDNTSDANKPVSTAQSAALVEKPAATISSLTGWYHADGYGADRTGAADSGPAITAAVAAAVAAGGGVVYLPPGTFKISTTINMSSIRLPFGVGGVTLRGAGINATTLVGGETAFGFIELVDSTGITIENIALKVLSGSTQFGILGGRTTGNASSGNHRFRNVLIYGSFTVAGLFMLNSESCSYEYVTVRTLAGPAAVFARDTSNWSATAKYVPLSTTVGYGGGNGVITTTGSNFLTYGTSATDVPLTVEFAQTFTSINCYTLTSNAPSVVLSKGIYQASFIGIQQEWSGVGSEPLGFSCPNIAVSGETPNVRMSITGSTVYPVLGADGVVFANFAFIGSRWRGTARTYQYDVDSSYDANIQFNPNATQISGEATAPKYRVRGSTSDTGVTGGSPISVPIGAPVPAGTPANRLIVRIYTGTSAEIARNKAINPSPLTGTTGWLTGSQFAGTGGTMTATAQTTGGPSAGSPSRYVYTWTVAPSSNGVYGGYGRTANTDIACTPGDTMTFAAWIKPSWAGASTGVRVLFYTSGGALIGGEILGTIAVGAAGAWERRTVTTVVPATSARAILRLYSQNVTPTVSATLEVSSVTAEIGSIAHAYFDGGQSPDTRFTSSWLGAPFASESALNATSSYSQFWDGTTTWNL